MSIAQTPDIAAAPQSGVAPMKAANDSPGKVRSAAQEFESLFINQMLKTMRQTVMKSGLFDGGSAEEMYTSMLDAELSRAIASGGGIGLSEMLLRQLQGEDAASAEQGEKALNLRMGPAASAYGALTGGAKKAAQALRFPTDGVVSSGFGLRKDPFTGEQRLHRGMDIAAREGTPILAAASGEVIFSGKKRGYGNIVEIRHDDGMVTRYAHASKTLVKQGDRVNTSEPVGLVGSTGRSTGAHLHFEVMKDGEHIDPAGLAYG